MKIIKRNGKEVEYDGDKIITAVGKANVRVDDSERMSDLQIRVVEEKVRNELVKKHHTPSIEEIQDLVIHEIMRQQAFRVAQLYTEYRYKQMLIRKKNSTDDAILSLIEYQNEEIKQENSNKNPMILSTQRDYIAGESSKDLTWRVLLPSDIVKAHEEGILHFHDADYFIHHMHNCCLINLEDMLDNGTVITETKIDPPKSIITACTVASQIIAQVASSQFGGQTFALSHLVPFVQKTRIKHMKRLKERFAAAGIQYTDDQISHIVEEMVKDDIRSGIQTIQYQLLTLMTTNGQTPFVSMYININDVPKGQGRDDFITMITEVFRQRIVGIKNEKGVYVTAAFPKILYVLDENNIYPDSEYIDLTILAAKCTAARMVPDYISAKIMREYTDGDVYGCMGCVDGKSVIDYMIGGNRYVESFERVWERLAERYTVHIQPNGKDQYMDTSDVSIWDNKLNKYVKQHRIIRNRQTDWYKVNFTSGRYVHVTNNHPFEIEGKGVVLADDLMIGDTIRRYKVEDRYYPADIEIAKVSRRAWLAGLILCDGCYATQVNITLGLDEQEIASQVIDIFADEYGLKAYTREQHRGVKGDYIEIKVHKSTSFGYELKSRFGGVKKMERHIPEDIFNADRVTKLCFLAGMIDADGYVNNANNVIRVQLGSTNEELALQQMMLAIDLGLNAAVYSNRYNKADKSKIRYRVEFNATKELADYLVCKKKLRHFDVEHTFYENTRMSSDMCSVKSIEPYYEEKYSYDVTTESEHFMVNGIYSHNCRSFLTKDRYTGKVGNIAKAGNFDKYEHHYWGRFNQGVVTINLVDVALSSGGDMKEFWKLFDERLELCHRALRCRHERLLGTPADMAPILWRYGALARLEKGEVIDKLLYNGYSTLSLGYAGLYEMCYYMTGKSHTDPEGEEFALQVMQHMNDKTAEWKSMENIDYSLYGTPLESTTYRFAKLLQNRFGVIENVTDHNYITNSYHINVREKVDAFTKLMFESKFQKLSPGGAISYVEMPDMKDNIPALLTMIRFIYDNIKYAEFNSKSDYCWMCGYNGEIAIVEDEDGKLVWECPNCGNRDQNKMNVARRTCGR